MAQTKVRVFFNEEQILGVVIPDHDEQLDLHHKAIVKAPHEYIDLPTEEYLEHALEDGTPDIFKLFNRVRLE